ncbi:2'-5' RNA ligase family protein [Variovorax sp. HJSM1_2]|uniref:2'-5' RNA ligase family protein n=1 Tax=Variovorax sp. HJSM1_2 TaxID=3366263 RepID=UPI003BC044E5
MHNQHRFFFAVRLSPEAAAMAREVAGQQMARYGLPGRPIDAERLHITLHWLGDYDHVPQELVRCAMYVESRIELGPFNVGFDRVGSFEGDAPGGLALTSTVQLKSLGLLQRAVGKEMRTAGIGQLVRSRFNPHVTLVYKSPPVPCEPIAPICWPVNELVLIHSYVGLGKHVDLGNWPLPDRQLRLDLSPSSGGAMTDSNCPRDGQDFPLGDQP